MESIIVYKYKDTPEFYVKNNMIRDISSAMKKFNDYDENNYI